MSFLLHCWKYQLPSNFKTTVSVLFDTVCIGYHCVHSLLNTICYEKSFYLKQTNKKDNFLTIEMLNDYCRVVIFLVNWKYYGKVKYANSCVFRSWQIFCTTSSICYIHLFHSYFLFYHNYFSSCLKALVGCVLLVLEVICSMYLRYSSQCFILGVQGS